MATASQMDEMIRSMIKRDPRYIAAAYQFVLEALDYAMLQLGKHRRRGTDRHLTVDELLDGIRCFTIAQYGPLGRLVLESMRIYDTSDLGEIVFNLVDAGLLNKQDTDSKEAFSRGFSFHQAFEVDAFARLDL
jgi:uncharacterized repeat protein (TIGR04138 family)